MSVNALTLVNSLPVLAVIGRGVDKEGVAEELLAAERSVLQQLITANAAIEAAAPAPQSFWGGVLRSALIGASVAGLGGAVFQFIQRCRKTGPSRGGPS
jgi:hypothetical protein